MCVAGVLLFTPKAVSEWLNPSVLRLGGAVLGMGLTLTGVYTQFKAGIPYWLPCVNTVLAGVVIWTESGRGRGLV